MEAFYVGIKAKFSMHTPTLLCSIEYIKKKNLISPSPTTSSRKEVFEMVAQTVGWVLFGCLVSRLNNKAGLANNSNIFGIRLLVMLLLSDRLQINLCPPQKKQKLFFSLFSFCV